MGDQDDVMEKRLTIDYDKQWLNCVSAIGPNCSCKTKRMNNFHFQCINPRSVNNVIESIYSSLRQYRFKGLIGLNNIGLKCI